MFSNVSFLHCTPYFLHLFFQPIRDPPQSGADTSDDHVLYSERASELLHHFVNALLLQSDQLRLEIYLAGQNLLVEQWKGDILVLEHWWPAERNLQRGHLNRIKVVWYRVVQTFKLEQNYVVRQLQVVQYLALKLLQARKVDDVIRFQLDHRHKLVENCLCVRLHELVVLEFCLLELLEDNRVHLQ